VLEMGTNISGHAFHALYLGESVTESQEFCKFDGIISEGENCVTCQWENIKRGWGCGLEIHWMKDNVTVPRHLLLYSE
jgi:hypothetical protein